jgi:hypothetical protein
MNGFGCYALAVSRGSITARFAIAVVALCSMGRSVAAQQGASSDSDKTIAALTIVGLASIQPADNSYVGAPYLDQGLGGIGLGAAAGFSLFTPSRFSATLEVSTASLSVTQHGRLAGGTAEGRLNDTLVSMLAGVATSTRALLMQAGVSWVGGAPSQNGAAILANCTVCRQEQQHLVFTAGFDAARDIGERTALVANLRYSILPRHLFETQAGVGRQVVRVGFGVRLRLN